MNPTCPRNLPLAIAEYLRTHACGEDNAIHQEPLAEALGMSVRELQDILSDAAQHDGHIGSGVAGVWYSESVSDHRAAYSYLAGRIGPQVRRMRAIEKACPQVATERLMEL
jgi:hypothetical protein